MKTSEIFKVIPFATVAMLLSCTGGNKETVVEVQKPMVRVETVHTQDVDQLHEFTATVEANIINNIAPQMAARIEKVFVEVGDNVRQGQLLAQMDQSNLLQSKIQLENIETEFNRIDELYKVGGASKSSWDAQKTSLEVARTALANLEENTRLLSPISGVVTARNYDSGDLYSDNPLYVVEQINPVKVMLHVSESFYSQIKKGNPVDIKLDVYGDQVFKGNVFLVYPTIDPNTRTFPVEIRIPNPDGKIRPGMFARVTMNFGTQNRVVAPDLAIVKQAGAGDRTIYVVENGKIVFKNVELGRRMGNRYEIISGVNDGDVVVVAGHNRVFNGVEVEIEK